MDFLESIRQHVSKGRVDFVIGACFENYYRYVFFYPAGPWVQGFFLIPPVSTDQRSSPVLEGQGRGRREHSLGKSVRQPGDSLSKTQVDVT